jgi:hypothetical protein
VANVGLAPADGSADGPSDDLTEEVMDRIVEGLAEGLAAAPAKPAGAGGQAADRDDGKRVTSFESERRTEPEDRPAAFGPPRAVPSLNPEAEGPAKGASKPDAPSRGSNPFIPPRRDDEEK